MSAVEVVDKLLQQPKFAELVDRIEKHWGSPLAEYIRTVPAVETVSAKAVKDAVWGMIDLHGQEVIVLDSPVLQRLRHVR